MNELRKKRIEAKLTRKKLGDMVGVTDKAIYWYETGKREPGIALLKRFAEIFKCTVDELIK
jgi:transcriptional regulator with XRE-family HTH domain